MTGDFEKVISWKSNKAMTAGRDHKLFNVNRQDFCETFTDEGDVYGIVCDGCGSGLYTEVGASLIGNFILRLLSTLDLQSFNSPFDTSIATTYEEVSKETISQYIEAKITLKVYSFIEQITTNMQFENVADKVKFINDYFLTTFIFGVVLRDFIVVGHCGDGVIVVDNDINVIDQGLGPHYLAYNNVPKEALQVQPSHLQGIKISIYNPKIVSRIAIGTDGLTPLVEKVDELFNVPRLQRKFNVWSKDKIFFDDAACVTFEKVV